MVAEQILRLIAGLLVGVWVARYLGPTQFGVFSYVVSFVALFSSIAKLGLDNIVVRSLIQDPNQRDLYLGTAFWLKIFGSVAMLTLMALAVQLTSNDSSTNLYIFVLGGGVVFQSFEVVDFYFQSKVLSKFVSISKLTQLTISSLLKIYLIFINTDLFWFVVVSLVDQITLAVSLYLAYRYQKLGSFYRRFDLTTAKLLIRDSWPFIVSGLVVMIYMRIDQIMIKEMLGENEVGIYSAAIRISELWYFIPMLLTNSLFPSIVNAKKISEELYYARLQRLLTFLVWMSIGVALVTTFLAHWLVVSIYGDAYESAGSILIIHIWTGVFVALGVASGSWFAIENLQQYLFYRTILGAIVNVMLNFILIPLFGLTGAAVATVVAQTMATFLFDAISPKTRLLFVLKLKAIYFPRLS